MSFACDDDRRLGSFWTKNTPMVLDTIRNGIVYEPLAKLEQLYLIILGSRLDSSLLTHCHDISMWFVVHILVVTPAQAWERG